MQPLLLVLKGFGLGDEVSNFGLEGISGFGFGGVSGLKVLVGCSGSRLMENAHCVILLLRGERVLVWEERFNFWKVIITHQPRMLTALSLAQPYPSAISQSPGPAQSCEP